MIEKISDIVFPRRCPVCGEVTLAFSGFICEGCRCKLPYVEGTRCMRCGRPIVSDTEELCFECTKKHHHYRSGFSVFLYNEDMRRAMSDFKFNNRRDNGDFFVDELVRCSADYIRSFKPDMLVPVPVHRRRLKERGFNQAELLAEGLGSAYDIPVVDALQRNRKTLPQKKLSDTERLRNLAGAFALSEREKNRISGRRILLVDDIYTTGSTVETCSEKLLEGGAMEVGFISVCIGKGY